MNLNTYRKKIKIALMLKSFILTRIISKFSKKKLYLKELCWIDELDNKKVLVKSGKCLIYSPNFENRCQELESILPSITLHIFENVFGSANSSSFYNNNYIFVERFINMEQSDANYSSGHLIAHNTRNALIRKNRIQNIDATVLFLGGNGSCNYFHWLIEILPKLLFFTNDFIKNLDIEAIFINSKVLEVENFKLGLELLNEKLGLKIISVPQDENVHFRKVMYINTFNQVLYNSKSQIIDKRHNYFHRESLIKLREIIFESNQFQNINFKKKYPKKIFLLRGSVSSFNRRNYNENEIYLYLQENGFDGVKTEEYTFFEQAYLFYNASEIIGPSGAFWSNLIFCQSGTKAISWLSGNLKNFATYSTLAKYFNVQKKFLHAKSLDKNIHGAYIVDLQSLIKLYECEF